MDGNHPEGAGFHQAGGNDRHGVSRRDVESRLELHGARIDGRLYEREADLFGVEPLIPEFLFHKHRREFPTGLDGVKGLAELFQTSITATRIRYAKLSTEALAVVVSEGDRILYSVLSKPFASRFGESAPGGTRARQVSAESITRKLNAGGKIVAEERGAVRANRWFPEASGELVEEVIRLEKYGKTLTVLSEGVSFTDELWLGDGDALGKGRAALRASRNFSR